MSSEESETVEVHDSDDYGSTSVVGVEDINVEGSLDLTGDGHQHLSEVGEEDLTERQRNILQKVRDHPEEEQKAIGKRLDLTKAQVSYSLSTQLGYSWDKRLDAVQRFGPQLETDSEDKEPRDGVVVHISTEQAFSVIREVGDETLARDVYRQVLSKVGENDV